MVLPPSDRGVNSGSGGVSGYRRHGESGVTSGETERERRGGLDSIVARGDMHRVAAASLRPEGDRCSCAVPERPVSALTQVFVVSQRATRHLLCFSVHLIFAQPQYRRRQWRARSGCGSHGERRGSHRHGGHERGTGTRGGVRRHDLHVPAPQGKVLTGGPRIPRCRSPSST
jgi:hypothetical protein